MDSRSVKKVDINKTNLDLGIINKSFWTDIEDQPGQEDKGINVVIDSDHKYQEIEGVGGSFSEIGWQAISTLAADQQEKILADLFSQQEAGFSYCRFPIGSSDFAFDAYSLNDNQDDYAMQQFNLERDKKYLIPFIKGALKYNPELKFHVSSWSPPAWMKTNKSFVEGGSLVDEPRIYKAYAKYLVKFIKGYQEEGININRLLIQNEPDSAAPFPSCVMLEDQMTKFTVDYLYPEFKDNGIKTEIWGGTYRTITGLLSHQCIKDPEFREVVDGIGFQYSIPEHIKNLQILYPEIRVMHTESVCYNGENSWEQSVKLFNDFINYINAGCTVYTYWNMVLNEKQKSSWGWSQNSLISIDRETGEVNYNPDYYIMKLLSEHVKPGSRRIDTFCISKKTIAFENLDGKIILLISNLKNKGEEVLLNLNNREIPISLPSLSINAITM